MTFGNRAPWEHLATSEEFGMQITARSAVGAVIVQNSMPQRSPEIAFLGIIVRPDRTLLLRILGIPVSLAPVRTVIIV